MNKEMQMATARLMGYQIDAYIDGRYISYMLMDPDGKIIATTSGQPPNLNHWIIRKNMRDRGIEVGHIEGLWPADE